MLKNRTIRIGVLIKQVVFRSIKNIIELDDIFVTIMEVVLTKDLSDCKIYYSVFSNNKTKQKVMKILNRNLKHIRHNIALHINLRHTPNISFIFDNTNERANRLHNIFNKITKEEHNSSVYK